MLQAIDVVRGMGRFGWVLVAIVVVVLLFGVVPAMIIRNTAVDPMEGVKCECEMWGKTQCECNPCRCIKITPDDEERWSILSRLAAALKRIEVLEKEKEEQIEVMQIAGTELRKFIQACDRFVLENPQLADEFPKHPFRIKYDDEY